MIEEIYFEYTTFLWVPGLEPHPQIQFSVIPRALVKVGVIPFCSGAAGVFYSPGRQGG